MVEQMADGNLLGILSHLGQVLACILIDIDGNDLGLLVYGNQNLIGVNSPGNGVSDACDHDLGSDGEVLTGLGILQKGLVESLYVLLIGRDVISGLGLGLGIRLGLGFGFGLSLGFGLGLGTGSLGGFGSAGFVRGLGVYGRSRSQYGKAHECSQTNCK